MAGTAAAGGRPPRVSMQEHMAIDVSPGPIRPIRLISHYFPHFYPLTEPTLHPPDQRPAAASTIRSAPQPQPDPEPERDSDDSTALATLEFTLLFDADNSALHCTAHRAKGLKPLASGSVDTYVKANLLPGNSKASQLQTRTIRGTRVPVWEETLTYHGFTRQDAVCKTLRLCVCEDPWLRRRRRAPPLGELQVPLRKLVPNRARSFNIYLEKRRLAKRPKSLDTARGMSLYEEFFYSGPREELAQKTLLVSVWDYDLGTADDFIGEWEHEELGWGPSRLLAVPDPSPMAGGVQLGSHASGERLRHWLECLGHSDHRLELWHPLDSKPVQLSN
uniref:double C2-like domain-containing protein gamma isoform X4 n=1 Tax=Macaca mulatta TaxID=9544 RepID=UPI0010A257CE|nr:double C2-like domain-containing protein gamma isoform X4 [Macaca mulatta]